MKNSQNNKAAKKLIFFTLAGLVLSVMTINTHAQTIGIGSDIRMNNQDKEAWDALEKHDREKAAREKADREKADRERADRERAEREKAVGTTSPSSGDKKRKRK